MENKLAEESGLTQSDYWKIAIYYPPPESMSPTGINISILRQHNNSFNVVEIGKDEKYEDIQQLIERIRNERLKIRVFASASLSQVEKEKIKQNTKRHFESVTP